MLGLKHKGSSRPQAETAASVASRFLCNPFWNKDWVPNRHLRARRKESQTREKSGTRERNGSCVVPSALGQKEGWLICLPADLFTCSACKLAFHSRELTPRGALESRPILKPLLERLLPSHHYGWLERRVWLYSSFSRKALLYRFLVYLGAKCKRRGQSLHARFVFFDSYCDIIQIMPYWNNRGFS